MSQMVLPQSLPKAKPAEASASANAQQRTEKNGDSAFDEVSRAEQKRLDDARAANKSDASSKSDDAGASRTERDEKTASAKDTKASDTEKAKDSKVPKTDDAPKNETASAIETEATKETAEQSTPDSLLELNTEVTVSADEQVDAEVLPVTFAGLQSLAQAVDPKTPAGTNGTAASLTPQGAPALPGMVSAINNVLNSGTGKAGSLNLQSPGQGGSVTNLALSEAMLAGVSGEAAKSTDSPMLQNAIRFQGSLEMASQQANVVNSPKLAPEGAVLRGYTTSIDVPVGNAEWGDKMAGKLTWLTARNMSVAEIHLTPPDMGPMEVRVQVQQDQANITVHSSNPVVRDQLELHSHRLRDMLNEQGLSLEQFDVSDSNQNQTQDGDTGEGNSQGGSALADADQDESGGQPQSLDLTWKGEVDVFA